MNRRPFPTLASAAALLLLSTSCFTTTLWGGGRNSDDLVHTLGAPDDQKPDFGPWAKVLLTPFALALDLCTAPVQAAFNKLDDEDDDC